MNNDFANQLANNDLRKIVEKLNTYSDRYGEEPELYKGFIIHQRGPGPWPERWFIASWNETQHYGSEQYHKTFVVDNHGDIYDRLTNLGHYTAAGRGGHEIAFPNGDDGPLPDIAIDTIKYTIKNRGGHQGLPLAIKYLINTLKAVTKTGGRRRRRTLKSRGK